MPGAVSILLYVVGAVALLLVLAFLSFTGYLVYIHWKYSHIPQPKRPRWVVSYTVYSLFDFDITGIIHIISLMIE
jgi:hypothetical protein